MFDGETFAFLLGQVEEMHRAYNVAKANFWAVAGRHRPSDLSSSDEVSLVSRAMAVETLALNAYLDAMTRLNRYLLNEEVPQEVRDQLGKIRPGAHDP